MDKEEWFFVLIPACLILLTVIVLTWSIVTSGVSDWCKEAGRVQIRGQWYVCYPEVK